MTSSDKKYGLILPGKPEKPSFEASYNVFGEDSDSEEEKSRTPIVLQPSKSTNRQTRSAVQKAIQEDPTVYQYDEVYDEMVSEKKEKKVSAKVDKKPKYIENLLKTANKRKLENERRIERQIQKEREKEGDEFADKEVFVTSAYKKKLEEMRQEEEREKREEYLESIGDITKQADLGGFYRHLYEQKLGSDKKPNKEEDKKMETGQNIDDEIEKEDKNKKKDLSRTRQYRKRKSTDSNKYLSEGEVEDSDDEINHINFRAIKLAKTFKKGGKDSSIDADSDFLSDGDEDVESVPKNDTKQKKQESPKTVNAKLELLKDIQPKEKAEPEKNNMINDEKEEKKVKSKPKVDIWKKRTVGEMFEQALKRYYERKAARGL